MKQILVAIVFMLSTCRVFGQAPTQHITIGASVVALTEARVALKDTPQSGLAKNIPTTQGGVLVIQVIPDGAFARAGIMDADIIVRVGSTMIKSREEFLDWMLTAGFGKNFKVELLRNQPDGKWARQIVSFESAPLEPDPSVAIAATQAVRIKRLELENQKLLVKILALESQLKSTPLPTKTPDTPTAAPPPPPNPRRKGTSQASDLSIKCGDIEVAVVDYGVGKIALTTLSSEGMTDQIYYFVKLQINNLSLTKKYDYRTFRGRDFSISQDFASAKDNFGNNLKRIDFGFASQVNGAIKGLESLYPNSSLKDILVFERPVDGATSVSIKFPPANIGGKGELITVELLNK